MDLNYFFAGARDKPLVAIVRKDERVRLPVNVEALRPHAHPGVEFVYVLSGALSIQMNGAAHALKAGDSMYFDSSVPHAYRRAGGRTCSAIVVTAP